MIRGLATVAALLLWAVACLAPPHAGAATAAAPPAFGHAIVAQRDGEPRLLVDGKPFFFWGGAFFYERIPASQWRTSMLAMRALGANTLDLYVPWNWHELADGDFDFDGHTDPRRNLREVLRLGRELGFHFIVRPGPVIRNEWRNGGYPAWLLTRPEYDMPLHDVLEGRYPATATLQNAHSDDAAAEWMRNATHLRYASRWLHRALDEFRPYADLVLAVQLDDDQGAYIDNQTYPAPHLQAYLRWLDAQVRDVAGPLTPTFINTYQMRVPSSSPVWTMGNWYQSDAYTIGDHDRTELDFSSALLRTNRHGPFAQSEFQAGWLAGPEDPAPRPADPTNTALALGALVAWGATGVVDFPLQDTLAPFGWEAPFSNALYAWDAAIPYTPVPSAAGGAGRGRAMPTATFGAFIRRWGSELAATHRFADVGIAWSAAYSTDAGLKERTETLLRRCETAGAACDLVDLTAPDDEFNGDVRTLVAAPSDLASAAPAIRVRLRRFLAAGGRVTADVPAGGHDDTVLLVGDRASFLVAANWNATARTFSPQPLSVHGRRIALAPFTVAPRTVRYALVDVDGALLGRSSRERITTTCGAPLASDVVESLAQPCEALVRRGDDVRRVALQAGTNLDLHSMTVTRDLVSGPPARPCDCDAAEAVDGTAQLSPSVRAPLHGVKRAIDPARAEVYEADVFEDGQRDVVIQNDRVRIVLAPQGGARAVAFQRLGSPADAFDATGAWRDDLTAPLPPSARDYIAKYTHGYPAGTFNRAYTVDVVESGARARVRLRYVMPDAAPAGATFERIVTLEPHASRAIVDERLVAPGASSGQRAVEMSSLPALFTGVPLDGVPRGAAGDIPAETTALGTLRDGFVFSVAWRAGDVQHAAWTPYRSTGTLALTLAPGWRRVVYTYAPVADAAEARAVLEAERAWVAANPANAGP